MLIIYCYNYTVIKKIWSKYKRIIWIAFAIIFLVVLFLLKTTLISQNKEISQPINQESGLTSSDNTTLENLVAKDSNGNGIPDWEESLYGLDPTKKETTPGISNSSVIEKLKMQQTPEANTVNQTPENLTQTDKFSRELFTTVTTLSQNGQMDQAMVDQLGNSLADKIQNSVQRKIYTTSDIKIIDSDTKQDIQKYSDTLNNIYLKYNVKKGVLDIWQEFIADENNTGILSQLDPIITQSNKIISGSLKIQVPSSLSFMHLNLINNFELMTENVSDMKLFDSDTIVAISAISQYEKSVNDLMSSINTLTTTIKQKLNN